MKGFIVYPNYVNIDNQTYIQLFGRLENNESFVAVIKFNPYFYIKEADLKKAKEKIEECKCKVEKTKMKTFSGEEVIKVISENFTTISKLSKDLNDNLGIKTYEADIKPHIRYLIDNNVYGSIEINGDYETSEKVNRVYRNPEIKSSEGFFPKLKVLSIDIETIEEDLLCISLYSKNYEKTFIVSKGKVENGISCKNEEELLEKFKKEIIEFDPDIITGWNVINFDFSYLKQKFEKYKIKFDLGRTNENARIRIESNFFKNSTMDIPGRLVLDGLTFIKDPQIQEAPTIKYSEFESYTLEDVSQELLGKGKLLKGKNKLEEIEKLYEKNKEKFVEYNLLDAKLVYEILEKTKLVDLAIERSQLTGMPLDKVSGSIANFDSLYIREANKKGLVSISTSFGNKEERIKGGFVMSPKPGLYDNVLVFDFKSLYPSIIRTFNIDPSSFLGKIENAKSKEKVVIAPNGACFKNQEGILPKIIERLFYAREKAKREKRELSSYAIKVIMNSFFGVLASPNCRYYNLDMANAITSFGQEIIKLTAKKIEEKGFKVIYSDTDSVFVFTNLNTEETKILGKKIEQEINKFYEQYIRENYARDSKLELEFEKIYLVLLMPQLRTKIKKEEEKEVIGAKKRYAGLLEKDGKNEIEIVGLEAIRGDWTEAAKEFQIKLLEKVFNKEDTIPFIKSYIKELKQGKFDNKLIYRKSIRKELHEYTKTTPPHVKAARQLENLESNIIEYVITTEGPEPIQKLRHKIDYEHYIEKQIKPIARTILETLNIDFETAIKGAKQKTLF